jgi:hypothetical protein
MLPLDGKVVTAFFIADKGKSDNYDTSSIRPYRGTGPGNNHEYKVQSIEHLPSKTIMMPCSRYLFTIIGSIPLSPII